MGKRTKSKGQVSISQNDVVVAAPRMMMSSNSHKKVAVMCINDAGKVSSKQESLSLNMIALENVLFSIEQSMRLFLLIEFYSLNSSHDLESLFSNIRNKLGHPNNLRDLIIQNTNIRCNTENIAPVSEKDIKDVLQRHKLSYSMSRYMLLDNLAKPIGNWSARIPDIKILHCLAIGFIWTNIQLAKRKNIPVDFEVKRILESELTEDQKERVAWVQGD